MKRKKIALVLSLIMTLTSINIPLSQAQGDIENHWAKQTITKWQQEGLLKGDKNGNINPDNNITRAEFITLINKALGYNKTGDKIKTYKDIKQTDWYYSQIMTAIEQGYINGTSKDTISPNSNITRQEVMTIINKIANTKSKSQIDKNQIKDIEKTSSWAKQSVQNMIENGYIAGYQNQINPTNKMTRAEAITLIEAYKQNNRTLSFKGEYNLGQINNLTILTGDITIKDTQIQDLIIDKQAKGKIQLQNVQIKGKIQNNSSELQIIQDKEENKQENKQEQQKYKDGQYEGKARGYTSEIKVKVTIEKGKISKIEVIEQKEDQIYWNQAKKVIDRIIEKQDSQVDISAGATISSKGIMYAVQDALGKAENKKEEIKAQEEYKDGEYIGEANGFSGTVKVKVTIKDKKIEQVEVISHSDDTSYMDSAKNIIQDIKRKQKAEVEVISGATYSSNGIINATKDALEQAKGKTTKPGQSEYARKNMDGGASSAGGGGTAGAKQETDFTDLKDGEYEGTASGYYTNSIKVKVTVSAGKITKIELTENKDDRKYFTKEKEEKLIKSIIDNQSTKVDTMSGATISSIGVINAVVNALENAKTKIISQNYNGDGKTIFSAKVTASDITIKNITVNKDVIIDKKVGDGNVTLENVIIKGDLKIQGGGENSIHLKKVTVEGIVQIEKAEGQRVRLVVEENSQIEKKVEVRTPAIIQTVGNTKIETVELPQSLDSEKETKIDANVGKLDIKTIASKIKVTKESNIGHIELPKTVGEYSQGKSEYKKDKFELEIEDPSKIQSGSSKNVFGTFKFLTKEEVKQLDNKTYKDGVYYGDGFGFVERKPIPVKVTVSGGKITDISLVEEELTKVDTEWKPGQKAKIDDGEAYAMRFDIVNNLVKKNQNPNALAYRLGTLRDVYRLVRKGVGATDIAGYNANFDKIVGKHEFGSYNLKLQKGDEHNINNKLMSLLRTYAVEDLGYGKAEYDAISGATFTAIGTSQAISNALKKADDSISFYDMRIKDGYKEKFTEGTPIDLSDLKVDFYQKDSTIKTVPYSQFEANGLKVLDRDTDKEIKNGTILSKENFGVSTLSVVNLKVVHEKSNSVKLLKKMTVLKGGVLCNVEKFQVKAKDSNEWIDTKGFNNTMTNGEVNDAQHLTVSYSKAHDLLHKELEFRIVAKRTDNNEEVIFTTRPSGASDKFIYPQKPKQDYRIFIDESSLKDANGTALKIDEKNSKYFRIFLKDDSTAPKLAETYKNAPHPITVTTGTMLTEEILKGAFDNLPQDSKINFDEQKAQELTVTAGDNKKLEVSVDFKDYSSKDYTLIINVKEEGHSTLAQQYNETPYTITVTTNTQLSVDRVKKALPNLPFNTQVEITRQPNTATVGNSDVQVRLTFSDNSIKDMTIPVIVKEAAQGLAGKFEQKENSLSIDVVIELDDNILNTYGGYADKLKNATKLSKFSIDNIKRELKVKTDDAYNVYGNIEVEILEEPSRKVIGQTTGKIKLKFNDNTSLDLDVPVNVTPMPVVYFQLRPLPNMKKSYSIDDTFNFDGLRGFVSVSTVRDQSNKWTDTGAPMFVPYKDFEYFGLKVVKTGTNEEIKQGSPVKDALTNGKIDLSVFRELGVISQEEEQKKVPQIKGLKLEKLAESFNKSSYATDGIEVETLVKPNDPRFQSLEIYSKKGFDSSLETALKEIENKYGEVTVEKISEPDVTSLGDTTAKIKLKFKDDSVSNEVIVKVKVKELPVFQFRINRIPKKQYNENDNIELDVISANVYIPKILDNKEYSVSDPEENPIVNLLYKDFKYFGFTVVKKDTEEEVSNGTQAKDLPRNGKQIVLDALCKKVYAEDGKNRVPIYTFMLK